MKLYIQYMVSLRCKMMVKSELDKLGIAYNYVELGEVFLKGMISNDLIQKLKVELKKSGLVLMDDAKSILIEKVVNLIVEMVHYTDEVPKLNFSNFLSEKLKIDYHKIAELFSKTKGITIEHFIKIHKVERIKELIIYDELNLSEISFKMHYSSLAHMSTQFKHVTGLSPTKFKNLITRKRQNFEDL